MKTGYSHVFVYICGSKTVRIKHYFVNMLIITCVLTLCYPHCMIHDCWFTLCVHSCSFKMLKWCDFNQTWWYERVVTHCILHTLWKRPNHQPILPTTLTHQSYPTYKSSQTSIDIWTNKYEHQHILQNCNTLVTWLQMKHACDWLVGVGSGLEELHMGKADC